MSTNYKITPGYGSGYAFEAPKLDALKDAAQAITRERLREQVERLDRRKCVIDVDVDDYLDCYINIPTGDLRVRFMECDDGPMMFGVASGGGQDRYTKEIFQAAFYSLVVQECLARGFNVCLEIH